ncbi:MAG: hypothetical protein K0Q55_4063 [Verrucomicrobia bacterium]|jgi:hypothetical protein|nr:hypothetical protein [Verrucomicrobiota bacterium]
MLKRLPFPLLLTLVLVGAFLAMVLHLFSLRFDAGDIYPPYSSLRSDPLGSRALYESLDGLPEISSQRWLEPGAKMPKLKAGESGVFFLLGLPHRGVSYLGKADVEVIEEYIKGGGHVVIAFRPISGTGWYDRIKDETEAEREKKAEQQGRRRAVKKDKDKPTDEPESERETKAKRKKRSWEKEEHEGMVSLTERWGFKFKEDTLPKDDEGQPSFVRALGQTNAPAGLPAELPWHSSLQFEKLSDEWKVIYAWEKEAVLVARDWGKGRLTMCADSYLFSNEALKMHRETAFLAWLIGDAQSIYFDESHLGVTQDPGVASLIRKYRLYGVAFALALLAGLFVWRNALSLVPPEEDSPATSAQVAGRDAGSGFLNLLFRSVKPKELLAVSYQEWRRTVRSSSGSRGEKMQEMETLVAGSEEAHPVELYRKMVKIWKRKA